MSKINVGDRVRSLVTECGVERGKEYEVIDVDTLPYGLTVKCSNSHGRHHLWSKEFELVKTEFEWGEEVEVSNGNGWRKAKFIGENINNEVSYRYFAQLEKKKYVADSFRKCRKPKTKVTLDEIAEWKGVDKDRIEIE